MRIALAGDTMLGRGVAEVLAERPPTSLAAPEVAELTRSADVAVLNLECCISDHGAPFRLPGKPYFFRAPPNAVELLTHLGIACVTLANNHALDFGEVALLDTITHLERAGIRHVGAGPDLAAARAPATLPVGGDTLTVIGFTDHPEEFAAQVGRPGVAYVDLDRGVDAWVLDAIAAAPGVALVTPHWGPNMVAGPRRYVRAAAAQLRQAGASLVAGHSAHVFQGVEDRVIYDLGDFLDDYRVDRLLRNDLGLLFPVDVDRDGPCRLEAVPLKLDYCHTGLANGDDARWIQRRFHEACAAFGEEVTEADGRLVIRWCTPPL